MQVVNSDARGHLLRESYAVNAVTKGQPFCVPDLFTVKAALVAIREAGEKQRG